MQRVKAVVIGTDGIGKTSMLITYMTNAFPSEYVEILNDDPDVYQANLMVDGKPIQLEIQDTSSRVQFNDLRIKSYVSDLDVIVICYDTSNIDTFYDVQSQWIPEIKHYSADTAYILVGLKLDVRETYDNIDNNTMFNDYTTTEQGKQLASEIGAHAFLEASSLTTSGNLKDIFLEAIRAVWRKQYNTSDRDGFKFKLNANHNHTSIDNKPNAAQQTLLIYGYIKGIHDKNIALNDIVKIIQNYLASQQRLYFMPQKKEDDDDIENDWNCFSKRFVKNESLPKYWWIMFWTDLLMILVHNFCYIVFSFVIYKQLNNLLSILSLFFSWTEFVIIVISYGLLICYDKIEYYSDIVYPMHVVIELFISLPLIILQLLYIYRYDGDYNIKYNYSLYISITIYFIYGLYKLIIMSRIWSYLNKIVYERLYILGLLSHCMIWVLCVAPSMLALGIYFINIQYSLSVGLIVLASLIICCIPCIQCFGALEASQQQRRRRRHH